EPRDPMRIKKGVEAHAYRLIILHTELAVLIAELLREHLSTPTQEDQVAIPMGSGIEQQVRTFRAEVDLIGKRGQVSEIFFVLRFAQLLDSHRLQVRSFQILNQLGARDFRFIASGNEVGKDKIDEQQPSQTRCQQIAPAPAELLAAREETGDQQPS